MVSTKYFPNTIPPTYTKVSDIDKQEIIKFDFLITYLIGIRTSSLSLDCFIRTKNKGESRFPRRHKQLRLIVGSHIGKYW